MVTRAGVHFGLWPRCCTQTSWGSSSFFSFITRELFLPDCALDAYMYGKNSGEGVCGRWRAGEGEMCGFGQIRHAEFGRVHR